MSAEKPTFVETVLAMQRYPVSPGDVEFAEALALTEDVHVPTEFDAGSDGKYGACRGCGEPWPCGVWSRASVSAVEWLIFASNSVIAHSNEVWRRHKAGEQQDECLGCLRGWFGHGPTCPRWTGDEPGLVGQPEQARLA